MCSRSPNTEGDQQGTDFRLRMKIKGAWTISVRFGIVVGGAGDRGLKRRYWGWCLGQDDPQLRRRPFAPCSTSPPTSAGAGRLATPWTTSSCRGTELHGDPLPHDRRGMGARRRRAARRCQRHRRYDVRGARPRDVPHGRDDGPACRRVAGARSRVRPSRRAVYQSVYQSAPGWLKLSATQSNEHGGAHRTATPPTGFESHPPSLMKLLRACPHARGAVPSRQCGARERVCAARGGVERRGACSARRCSAP
jgi:hypothetical protein